MAINKLSDRTIKSALKNQSPPSLWDGGGLHIIIKTAIWHLQYRFGKRTRLMSLGKYPDVTLEKARDLKDKQRQNIRDGIDPIENRKAHKTEYEWSDDYMFGKIAERWFNHWKNDKVDITAEQTWRRIELYVLPMMGKRDIRQLNDQDFIELFRSIDIKKRTISPKVYMHCKQILEYARSPLTRTIKNNPMGTFKAKDVMIIYPHKHHAKLSNNMMPDLINKIEAYHNPYVKCALKLLMLTFVRTMELLDANWDEVDFAMKQWRIPGERTKLKRPHIVPLSDRVISELQTIKSLAEGTPKWKQNWRESNLIFPWSGKGRRNVILNALYEMGYKGKMTGHGFRGIASTVLHDSGFSHEAIEMQLAHVERNKSSGAYNDALYIDARQKIMQFWADHLYSFR